MKTNKRTNEETKKFEKLLFTDRVILLNLVKIELLQGCGTDKEYKSLEEGIIEMSNGLI